jgi:hypothetical protein
VTADTDADRAVGNMMRFDNLQPGADGTIVVNFYSPGRVQPPPPAQPIRGPGINGMQLLINPPPVGAPPVITQQPASQNGIVGGQVTLTVAATGPSLTYQWLKNGQPIHGATDATYTLSNLTTNDPGNYAVAISNPAGTIRSRTVVVDVLKTVQITEDLIVYLPFDDGDGVVATNGVAGGQDGQVVGEPFPSWPIGQIGTSLQLNGSSDYVFVPNYTKPSAAVTIAGWVASADGTWGPIINNYVSGRSGIGQAGQFFINVVPGVDPAPTMLVGDIEVGPNSVRAAGAINGSAFDYHHFALSANGRTMSIYWDGALVSTVDYLGNINAAVDPWLSIGANLSNSGPGDPNVALNGNPFNGAVDDIAMWNRSLSGVEIQGLYNGGIAGQGVSQVPPVLNPALAITRTGSDVTISWPANLTTFTLQSTPSLKPANWTTVNGVANNSITITAPADTKYYRLIKQ